MVMRFLLRISLLLYTGKLRKWENPKKFKLYIAYYRAREAGLTKLSVLAHPKSSLVIYFVLLCLYFHQLGPLGRVGQ